MSNQNIDRAIELAGKVAHAEATGQPMLAELYEKNMLLAMAEARKEILSERVGPAVRDIIGAVTEMIKEFTDAMCKAFGLNKMNRLAGGIDRMKSDYALVGPGK